MRSEAKDFSLLAMCRGELSGVIASANFYVSVKRVEVVMRS